MAEPMTQLTMTPIIHALSSLSSDGFSASLLSGLPSLGLAFPSPPAGVVCGGSLVVTSGFGSGTLDGTTTLGDFVLGAGLGALVGCGLGVFGGRGLVGSGLGAFVGRGLAVGFFVGGGVVCTLCTVLLCGVVGAAGSFVVIGDALVGGGGHTSFISTPLARHVLSSSAPEPW